MKFISLFAGIGGFDLGFERAGMQCVAQVEIDPFCQKVLNKNFPSVPKFGDIRNVGKHNLPETDVICGGFPCQPFSSAGKRRGKEDDRYLWHEMFRIIQELKPNWVVGENVAGIINMELDVVISDLEAEGYTTETFIIPACAIGAPHRRDRVWIIAYSNSRYNARSTEQEREQKISQESLTSGTGQLLSYSNFRRSLEGEVEIKPAKWNEAQYGFTEQSWWSTEPGMGRVADGVPSRVDRLKSLGNAVVPQITEIIARSILQIENASNTASSGHLQGSGE